MKTSLKSCFENSSTWKLTEIKECRNLTYYVRFDRRFFGGFEVKNRFDGYFSKKYLQSLCSDFYGKKIHDMNAFRY